MPELPEVETTLRAILPVLTGITIERVEVLRPNMVLHDVKGFTKALTGNTIRNIERRGKYLLATLDREQTLILHLKMSGRLGLRLTNDPPLRYERIRFHLPNNQLLIFNDPRTLGRAFVVPTKNVEAHAIISKLGPDPLTITPSEFLYRLQSKRGMMKALLLNQSFLAGIGNIYADEALFLAKIDPRRSAESLNGDERLRLFDAIQTTLQKGIDNMGTSFSDFADLFGKPGQNQNSLFVYGRSGEACRNCDEELQRTVIGQRGTVWCPKCQK